MRVEWLPLAEQDLAQQIEWMAERSPWAAIDIGDRIMESVERLQDHPLIGRQGRVPGTRELAVIGTPYVVVHRVEADVVLILRLLHGARRWPPGD